MQCPRCMGDNTIIISGTHYVCNNPNCKDESGNRTQFKLIQDSKVGFPYNQIFGNRQIHEFYRKPYLKIETSGVKSLTI